MPQTSVTEYKNNVPKAGFLAEPARGGGTVTAIAKENIFAGLFAGQDSGDNAGTCRHPDAASEVDTTYWGIPLYDASREPIAGTDALYQSGDAVPLVKNGIVWVTCEGGANFGDPVFARHANGTLGALRADNAAGDATQLPGGSRWLDTVSDGERARVEVNLP